MHERSSWQGVPTILFFIANIEGSNIASKLQESMLCIDFIIKKSGANF
tara:strand:+ start:413 stop:556 length:144 start_codon:yes stop_codon:yes gene_type:complete